MLLRGWSKSDFTILTLYRMLNVRVVLVRPRNPLNIGAAARAMANFGFEDLAVVSPFEPTWRSAVSAVGAEALLKTARKARGLEEVIGDCQIVIGTTTVRNRRRERPIIRLPEIGAYLDGYRAGEGAIKIALLFGSEKTGLTEKYLERCTAYLNIPTASKTLSMNLSHAVAVCCYELSKYNGAQKSFGARAKGVPLATMDDRERLARHVLHLFESMGYLDLVSRPQKLEVIRQTLLQWNLRAADVRLLYGILRRLLSSSNRSNLVS